MPVRSSAFGDDAVDAEPCFSPITGLRSPVDRAPENSGFLIDAARMVGDDPAKTATFHHRQISSVLFGTLQTAIADEQDNG